MQIPKLSPMNILFGMVGLLLAGSLLSNREALLFCEKALFGEMETLRKEKTVTGALKFTDVCPELRQRQENNLNKWLEIILALMVQIHPPQGKE
jgi:hypothetical protein